MIQLPVCFYLFNMILMKIILYLSNFLFFGGGCCWMAVGVYLSSEPIFVNFGQILSASLTRPLIFYIAIGVIILGIYIACLSVLGCSAVGTLSKIFFALYIFGLVSLLIGECAFIIFVSITPKHIGLEIDSETLVDRWQRYYGIPGREKYTSAIDYLQSNFQCCGVVNGKEFLASWWKLRELARSDLVVPLSCCVQAGPNETSYLDPRPENITFCQNNDTEPHPFARHTEGCSRIMEYWLQNQIRQIIYISIGSIFYQLYLLLITIIACIKLLNKKKS